MDTVLVVGAGVVGAAAARELAPDHEVVLVDRDQVAAGATAKASGLISPQYDLNDHLDAASYALDAFRELDGTGHFEDTERRGVSLVREDELAADRRMVERAREADLGAELYDVEAAADLLPDAFDLSPFAAVAVYDEGGWVDSYTLATTFLAAAEADGADVLTGRSVEGVRVEDGRIAGVTTDAGPIDADHVVVAAGWRSRDLLADVLDVPVRLGARDAALLAPHPRRGP
ncbi:MAG: NAD(P)/FAD-dependent oxidoreductase, partial [Halanaeroarchaeum sp.]